MWKARSEGLTGRGQYNSWVKQEHQTTPHVRQAIAWFVHNCFVYHYSYKWQARPVHTGHIQVLLCVHWLSSHSHSTWTVKWQHHPRNSNTWNVCNYNWIRSSNEGSSIGTTITKAAAVKGARRYKGFSWTQWLFIDLESSVITYEQGDYHFTVSDSM